MLRRLVSWLIPCVNGRKTKKMKRNSEFRAAPPQNEMDEEKKAYEELTAAQLKNELKEEKEAYEELTATQLKNEMKVEKEAYEELTAAQLKNEMKVEEEAFAQEMESRQELERKIDEIILGNALHKIAVFEDFKPFIDDMKGKLNEVVNDFNLQQLQSKQSIERKQYESTEQNEDYAMQKLALCADYLTFIDDMKGMLNEVECEFNSKLLQSRLDLEMKQKELTALSLKVATLEQAYWEMYAIKAQTQADRDALEIQLKESNNLLAAERKMRINLEEKLKAITCKGEEIN